MPDEISGTKLYEPGENPREQQFKELLKNRWKDKYKY
jgi:putative ATPase